MNIILRLPCKGLLSLVDVIDLDKSVRGEILISYNNNETRLITQDSIDYPYLLFWVDTYSGKFNGGILDLETYYNKHINKFDDIDQGKYSLKFYEAA